MMIKILAYFLIPTYTILFTKGYNQFTTNFSVIGNLIDREPTFFLQGVMVGVYYYMVYRAVRKQIRLRPLATRLLPAALLLLFCTVTTLYLPGQLPLKPFLHIIFIFVPTMLPLVFLALAFWSQYPSAPRAYWPFPLDLTVAVVVSTVLLTAAGIISSALEIFLTVTTIILSSRLVDCLRELGGPDASSTCIMK